MRKILFIGLVIITAVVLVSGCYAPTTSPNATVQPTGGTPGEITPVMTPVETVIPIETATSVGITTVTETPYATATWTPIPNVTGTSYATTPVSTVTGTATVSATLATVNAVDITSTGYNPAIISVPRGTTVTWTNRDVVSHIIRGTEFNSGGSIAPGNTFSQMFNTPGSYDYSDSSNSSMSGTVVVT
jgi:plastocyanin